MSTTEEFLSDFDRDAEPAPKGADPRCGLFPDMSTEDYFADPIEEGSLSQSGIKILEGKTPLEFAFQHPRLNPDYAETAKRAAHIRRGDLVHQLALGKGKGYAIGNFKDWRTNDSKAFREDAEARGLTAVLEKEYATAEVLAGVIREYIAELLQGAEYQTEVPVIWREDTPKGSIYMRGMLDVWCPDLGVIIDPKVTERLYDGVAGEFIVNKHFSSMGWDRQAALYKRGVEMVLPELANKVKFINLLIAPAEPFVCRPVYPDQTMLMTALYECREPMMKFAECMASGDWPSFPIEPQPVSLSPWEENRRLDAMEIRA